MNFFKPATFSLYSIDGVSGVELSLQSYIAAALGHVFGREYINMIFRIEDTVLSCTGLFFLFLAALRRTSDFFVSLIPPLFVFASPVFIFYSCNYMPDTGAAAFVFMAIYFLLDYIDTNKSRDLILALFLFTLGALVKTSAAIYLLSFLGYLLIDHLRHFKTYPARRHLLASVLSVFSLALLAGQFFYIRYLNKTYESTLFLSRPLPFEDGKDFDTFINLSFKRSWIKEYLALPQYLLLALVTACALPFMKRVQSFRKQRIVLWFFIAGSVSMTALLGHNLHVHDYYMIILFLPVLAYVLLISVIALGQMAPSHGDGRKVLRIASFTSVLIIFFFADHQTYLRLSPDYPPFSDTYSSKWLQGGAAILDSLRIPKQDHVLVIDENPPNLPLVYFDRKGYHFSPGSWNEDITNVESFMKEKNLNIAILSEDNANRYRGRDSNFFQHFTQLWKGDRKAIYRLNGH